MDSLSLQEVSWGREPQPTGKEITQIESIVKISSVKFTEKCQVNIKFAPNLTFLLFKFH